MIFAPRTKAPTSMTQRKPRDRPLQEAEEKVDHFGKRKGGSVSFTSTVRARKSKRGKRGKPLFAVGTSFLEERKRTFSLRRS